MTKPRLDRRTGLCLLLFAAILAAYAPALLHGGFPWDDYKFVEANPRLVGLDGLRALWLHPGTLGSQGSEVSGVEVHWFPVLYTSFWIERRLWGSFWAPGFHGTNLALHFCNALLAWGLLARLRAPAPFLVALIWAVHPGAMEAVGFVMGRKDHLPALFFLLAAWLWLRPFAPCPHGPGSAPGSIPGWRRVAGTALLGLLGVLCKPTVVVAPMLLLLLHRWRGDPLTRGLAARLAALQAFLLGAALFQWFVYARLSYPVLNDFSFLERILLAARAAWMHLYLTLVPGVSPLRFHSWEVSPADPLAWGALLAGAGVLLAAARLRPRGRSPLLLALLWFLVCLAPTLGLVDHETLRLSFAPSRYRYLGSLGVWALAVGAGTEAVRRASCWKPLLRALGRGVLRGAGVAVLLAGAATTARFSILFSNDATWFQHQFRHAPASDWIATHFIFALIRAGHVERALDLAETRLLSDPSRLRYHRDRAIARMAAGRRASAEADFRALVARLEREPDLIPPDSRIGRRTATGPKPLDREGLHLLYFNYGVLLAELGRPSEAQAMFSRAQRVRPRPGEVWMFRTGSTDPPIVIVEPPSASGEGVPSGEGASSEEEDRAP